MDDSFITRQVYNFLRSVQQPILGFKRVDENKKIGFQSAKNKPGLKMNTLGPVKKFKAAFAKVWAKKLNG